MGAAASRLLVWQEAWILTTDAYTPGSGGWGPLCQFVKAGKIWLWSGWREMFVLEPLAKCSASGILEDTEVIETSCGLGDRAFLWPLLPTPHRCSLALGPGEQAQASLECIRQNARLGNHVVGTEGELWSQGPRSRHKSWGCQVRGKAATALLPRQDWWAQGLGLGSRWLNFMIFHFSRMLLVKYLPPDTMSA